MKGLLISITFLTLLGGCGEAAGPEVLLVTILSSPG